MRATIFNCCAKGDAKSPGTATSASAARNCVSALMDCAAIRAISRSIKCSRGCVINWRSSAVQALDPYISRLNKSIDVDPLMPTRYPATLRPASSTVLPPAVIPVKVRCALAPANRSVSRPAQPDDAPSGASACQYACWSLCENSFGGSGTRALMYSALDVGVTSGPTLSSTANCPLSYSGASGASAGAKANCPPPAAGALPRKTVACSASRFNPISPRAAA
ncbi:hypothetical protein D3C72_736900 [compost metagenome]